MRRIAVLNQKGGVGKTTTVANVSAALAMAGHRVLAMDLDPQAHLTIHLGVDAEESGDGSYEVLTKSASVIESAVKVRDNLFLLGANIDLVGAESELISVVGREIILREALDKADDDYDYLLIDCPPSLGLLSLNALAAVDDVIIPVQPHFLALQGFGKLLQTISLVSQRINPKLKVSAILLCMFDTRVTLSAEVKADIHQFLENARSTDCPWSQAEIIPVHIRRNIKLAEAPSYGKTIFEYEPKCNGSDDYTNVANYIASNMPHSASVAVNPVPAPDKIAEEQNPSGNIGVDQQAVAAEMSSTLAMAGDEELAVTSSADAAETAESVDTTPEI